MPEDVWAAAANFSPLGRIGKMLLYSPGWDENRAPRGWRWIWENRKKKRQIRTGMEKDGASSAGAADSQEERKRRLWMEYQLKSIKAHRMTG